MPPDAGTGLASLYNMIRNSLTDPRTGKFLSHYAKRNAEGLYDKLVFGTALGQKVAMASRKNKLIAEAVLYALDAFVIDERLPENNALQVFVKELIGDAPSELAGRFLRTQQVIEVIATPGFEDTLKQYSTALDPAARTAIVQQARTAIREQPVPPSKRNETLDALTSQMREYRADRRARKEKKP